MGAISDYYREIDILAEMEMDVPGEYFWNNTGRVEKPQADVILYLGCNVLRTLSLADEAARLVRMIEGEDRVVVMAGAAHCCGSSRLSRGTSVKPADNAGSRVFASFDDLSPKLVIYFCPVCEKVFDANPRTPFKKTAYRTLHLTEYLAENVSRLDLIELDRPIAVALHEHVGDSASRRDTEAARQVLQQLPGVRIVPGGGISGYGYQCFSVAERPTEKFIETFDHTVLDAERAGADAMISVYHACHRAFAKAVGRQPIPEWSLWHLVASMAGVPAVDRYKAFHEMDSEDAIWNEVRCRFADAQEEEVRAAIRKNLMPIHVENEQLRHGPYPMEQRRKLDA